MQIFYYKYRMLIINIFILGTILILSFAPESLDKIKGVCAGIATVGALFNIGESIKKSKEQNV